MAGPKRFRHILFPVISQTRSGYWRRLRRQDLRKLFWDGSNLCASSGLRKVAEPKHTVFNGVKFNGVKLF